LADIEYCCVDMCALPWNKQDEFFIHNFIRRNIRLLTPFCIWIGV